MADRAPERAPTDDDEPSRPAWARWITLGSLVLAAGALAWTIYSVGLYEILRRLALIGPWFLAVIGIEVVITLFDAGALHSFLRPDHRKVGYGRVVLAQVSSRAINAVTPLGSLGEVVKTTMLFERVSPSRAVAAVLLYNITVLEISFVLIALGATFTALLLDLPSSLRTMLAVSAAVTAGLAIVIPVLVAKGRLAGLVTIGRTLRVVPAKKARSWRKKLADIDEKLGDTGGARRRDRALGALCLLLSRLGSWLNVAILIHAAGGSLEVGFLVAVLTAGQVIQWLSTVVPMGLGVQEGGNYGLFRALGADPAIGVTIAIGKRVTQIIYAAIGIVLASINQTVKEAKAAHRHKVAEQRAKVSQTMKRAR
jgi:uncharacterized membrane protein YbhN (UPF0104 family)